MMSEPRVLFVHFVGGGSQTKETLSLSGQLSTVCLWGTLMDGSAKSTDVFG